jgi:deoxyribonuclease V
LRERLVFTPLEKTPATIAGADISFDKGSETVYAGIVVLRYPSLETIEEAGIVTQARFPYIPGLLSFRESPALLEVWNRLRIKPDVLVLDGQGTAHPRRMGIACHVGLWLDRPTLGCAKSLLCGHYEHLGTQKGDAAPLIHRKEQIGVALRTKDNTNPVFVSPGNRIALEDSVQLMLTCATKYRIPEPTRRAHLFVNRLRSGETTLFDLSEEQVG